MKYLQVTAVVLFFFSFPLWTGAVPLEEGEKSTVSKAEKKHNWVKTSVERELIPLESHSLKEWQNFIEKTTTCHISGKIRTEVWYCDIHHQTKSKIFLEEVVHSAKHK